MRSHQFISRHPLFRCRCFMATAIVMTSLCFGGRVPSVAAQDSSLKVEAIERLLETTKAVEIDEADEFSLKQYLEKLTAHIKAKTGTTLSFIPDVAELQEENIVSLDDVILPPMNLSGVQSSVQDQLDFIFSQTVDPELAALPQVGFVMVTTRYKMENTLFVRSYPVLDLMNPGSLPAEEPERGRELSGRFMDFLNQVHSHLGGEAIWDDTDPDSGGHVSVLNSKLVVLQTSAIHRKLRRFLEIVREQVPSQRRPTEVAAAESSASANEVDQLTSLHIIAIVGWSLAAVFATCNVMLLLRPQR